MFSRRIFTVAVGLLIGILALVVLPPAEQAAAATGGCGKRAHFVHTRDKRPFNAWACWIDNGDKIRVCDNSPGNKRHAHAELWLRLEGGATRIATEDDGGDRGCDTEGIDGGDLPSGVYHVSLIVWEQENKGQEPHNRKEIYWIEIED